mmetsp:Transcript_1789/g.5379  ORF Transcript_1789/g.5379 Transcript_1789/m.5379 type:complete len:238 (+) Transcript_1789:1655-2368(+)
MASTPRSRIRNLTSPTPATAASGPSDHQRCDTKTTTSPSSLTRARPSEDRGSRPCAAKRWNGTTRMGSSSFWRTTCSASDRSSPAVDLAREKVDLCESAEAVDPLEFVRLDFNDRSSARPSPPSSSSSGRTVSIKNASRSPLRAWPSHSRAQASFSSIESVRPTARAVGVCAVSPVMRSMDGDRGSPSSSANAPSSNGPAPRPKMSWKLSKFCRFRLSSASSCGRLASLAARSGAYQ